jgi:hypothetical protein
MKSLKNFKKGFSCYYATKEGEIYSTKTQRNLSGAIDDHGYRSYALQSDSKGQQTFRGHRAIAKLFVLNPDNKPHVNHIDGIKTNNSAENLEWCTAKENHQHSVEILGNTPLFKSGVEHHNAKLNPKKVKEIRERYPNGNCTFRSLAKEYGVSALVINQVIHNRIWIGV